MTNQQNPHIEPKDAQTAGNSADTSNKSAKHILIMAAGTGGHVFPALAVAKQLQAMGHQISWLGTTHGMENRLLADQNIKIHQINIKGMRGNGFLRLLQTPFSVLFATLAVIRLIRAEQVDAVAGFGGYVAAPGGLAARLARVPLVIHEQNAVAGMTNRYLAGLATKVLEAFPYTFSQSENEKIVTVGNPVRDDIVAVSEKKQGVGDADHFRLLIIGGSLGAKVLNDMLPEALELIDEPIQITHQCGKGHLKATQEKYSSRSLTQHKIDVQEFIKNMGLAYVSHDGLVCRAGASTVSEVAATGMAAIFVPLPHAVDDHQTANARFLSDAGGAVLLPQDQLTAQSLADAITQLLDRENRDRICKNALLNAKPDATQRAAECIVAVFN